MYKKYMTFRNLFTTKNFDKLNDPRKPLLPTYSKIWQKITKYNKNDKNGHFSFFYRIRREQIFKNGSFIFFSIFKNVDFIWKTVKSWYFFFNEQSQIVKYHHLCTISQLGTHFFCMPSIYRNKINRFCSYTNNYSLFQPIWHHTLVKM